MTEEKSQTPADTSPTPEHYSQGVVSSQMVGQPIDPALIAEVYELTPMMFTALKKVLRCGNGIKNRRTDIADIKAALDRELELMVLRKTQGGKP